MLKVTWLDHYYNKTGFLEFQKLHEAVASLIKGRKKSVCGT